MMNSKDFFTSIEGYYGKYPRPLLRREVSEYIKGMPEQALSDLLWHLKKTISTQYGFVPDIAAIETARREMRDMAPIKERHKQLPDPTAKSMHIEIGEMFKRVLSKVSERRKRENAEWLTYDGG